ncbi:MAG TPA: NmrA family NAD(P)-binding protein [Polyangia bacterium]|nr:NmrA family NAD(P)-binding protein [Polyangia bacterium]
MAETILITGATGGTNNFVVPALKAKGLRLRALVHSEAKGKSLRDAGVEVAVGDYADKASLGPALDGVGTVFFVTPANPDANAWATSFLEVARRTSKPRIVRLSVYGASPDGPTDNTRQHGRTDLQIVDSGLRYCILRPNFFMQNLFMSAEQLLRDGSMYWGMGDGRLAMIDVRDIADAAVAVLADNSWDGGMYELTGPEAITFHDAARAIGAALGRPVRYVPVAPEAVEQAMRERNLGDWFPTVMRDYSRAYAANWGARVSGLVQKLTGHAPRAFEAFAREVLAPALKR